MSGNITFTMIKPDAVEQGYSAAILKMITDAGFRIAAMKMTRLSQAQVKKFYEIHAHKPWFHELEAYMTRGPIIAAVLEKENAIEDFRKVIGATNPAEAAPGTVRKLYAKDIGENAIHGADSDENALREAAFHFTGSDIFDSNGNPIG